MYFIYSVAHLSSLFVGGMPASVAGHATTLTIGNSFFIRYVARFMWSSVVIITTRLRLRAIAISRMASAFWYVDFDVDSITAGRATSILPWAPAPIIYRSAVGNSCILRIANGILRSSPVKTNILSFGYIAPH